MRLMVSYLAKPFSELLKFCRFDFHLQSLFFLKPQISAHLVTHLAALQFAVAQFLSTLNSSHSYSSSGPHHGDERKVLRSGLYINLKALLISPGKSFNITEKASLKEWMDRFCLLSRYLQID